MTSRGHSLRELTAGATVCEDGGSAIHTKTPVAYPFCHGGCISLNLFISLPHRSCCPCFLSSWTQHPNTRRYPPTKLYHLDDQTYRSPSAIDLDGDASPQASVRRFVESPSHFLLDTLLTRRFPSLCESEMVKLIVGYSRKTFYVHRSLLCAHSDYFRACFEGHFAESKQDTIELSDPPYAVVMFLDWLYRDTIELNRDILGGDRMVPVYVFADRICSEGYTSSLLEAMWTATDKYNIIESPTTTLKLYECGLGGKEAAHSGLVSIVTDMMDNPSDWKAGKEEQAIKLWSTNPELMIDMQKEIWDILELSKRRTPTKWKRTK